MVNTYGCRVRAILAIFKDAMTYNGTREICGCDNCFFTDREEYDRAIEPAVMTDEIKKKREEALMVYQRDAASLVANHHGFQLRKSLRYEDTCAYIREEELVAEQTMSDR